MRIVAIETSGLHGSVATLEGESTGARLVREIMLSREQRTAKSLAPALRELILEAEWPPRSVGLVVVAVGPGSFTGLRIGVTTAKTFAYAVGAEVIGVNTLVALANQAPMLAAPLWTILDAQRQELFAARFDRTDGAHTFLDCEELILGQDAFLGRLQSGEQVIGPGLKRVAGRLPNGVVAVSEELWQLTAAAVGHVAWRSYQAGRRDDVWKLLPHYGRPSYADEKRPLK